MTSNPYYVPLYPNYSLQESDEKSKSAWSNPSTTTPDPYGASDPIAQFVAGRLTIIKATVREVLEEIDHRDQLSTRVLEAIDKDELLQKERLFQVAPHGSVAFTIGDPRRRAAIESELSALRKERRHEEVACWKDVNTLKRDLRDLLQTYREELRRTKVIRP